MLNSRFYSHTNLAETSNERLRPVHLARYLPQPVNDADAIMAIITPLLSDSDAGQDKVRLLGITLSNLDLEKPLQASRQLLLPFDTVLPVAIGLS